MDDAALAPHLLLITSDAAADDHDDSSVEQDPGGRHGGAGKGGDQGEKKGGWTVARCRYTTDSATNTPRSTTELDFVRTRGRVGDEDENS
jgi:hypothetical protein